MKKILVPTDFSEPATNAATVATEIARKSGGEVILLHIVEQPTKESFNVEGQIDQISDWEEKFFTIKLIERNKVQLLEKVAEIQGAGIPVRQILKMGNAFHGISAVITELNVDLVVMGTSGRSRLEEIIVGSNTEKVVRHSKCPVLTIHDQLPGKDMFKNIVYATSLSLDERYFSDVVVYAQKLFDARVHLVRINSPANFRPDTEVKRLMEKFARKLQLSDYTLNVFNDYSEDEGIINFADSINADLIAMATHGRSGLAHVITGSIAEDVANHSRKPVLTYVTNKSLNKIEVVH